MTPTELALLKMHVEDISPAQRKMLVRHHQDGPQPVVVRSILHVTVTALVGRGLLALSRDRRGTALTRAGRAATLALFRIEAARRASQQSVKVA